MRNRSFATLGLLALLTAACAFGQQRQLITAADIPFEFQVGKVVLPAGHYDVRRTFLDFPDGLYLVCSDCTRAGVFVPTTRFDSMQAQPEAKLVFNRYGNRYFLSKVIPAGYRGGEELSKSKAEREIARNTLKSEAGQVVLARR